MTHHGHISLYKGGQIITWKDYKSIVQRNKIINMWRHLYGEAFDSCSIHISPIPGEEFDEKGVNKSMYVGRSENGRMLKNCV